MWTDKCLDFSTLHDFAKVGASMVAGSSHELTMVCSFSFSYPQTYYILLRVVGCCEGTISFVLYSSCMSHARGAWAQLCAAVVVHLVNRSSVLNFC